MGLLNVMSNNVIFFHDCGHVASVMDVKQKLYLTARVLGTQWHFLRSVFFLFLFQKAHLFLKAVVDFQI